jgi:alpha-tubulin suppressor-like RCC1 family protein
MSPRRRSLVAGVLTAALAAGCGREATAPAATVGRVTVSPSAVVVGVGGTYQLTATVGDSAGQAVPGASVTWSSDDTTRVRISSSGLVQGVASPGSEVRAVAGGKTGYAEVVVAGKLIGLAIETDSLVVNPGGELSLRASVLDSAWGQISVGPTRWTSSDTTVATVDSVGALRARRVGTVLVTVSVPPLTATDTVVVRNPVATITIQPQPDTLVIGDSLQLAAVARDSSGNILVGRPVAWSTCCGGSVTVSSGGLATAVAGGPTGVVAAIGGVADTATVLARVDAPFRAMSAGAAHTCATTSAGTSYCWGNGDEGQLGTGIGIRAAVATPVLVAGGFAFESLTSYGDDNCALDAAGDAYCWGLDTFGQLGDSVGVAACIYGEPCRGVPARAADTLRFRRIAVGGAHACGVDPGGSAYCWGLLNALGAGAGGLTPHEAPLPVAGALTFTAIGAGEDHACALAPSGAAYCWGYNAQGQLGVGVSDTLWHTSPDSVVGGVAFVALAMERYAGCGLTSGGVAYCWGDAYPAAPAAITSPVTFDSISGGFDFACGLSSTGAAYCWGKNDYGQLGDSSTTASTVPVAVHGGLRFTRLAAGGYHVCGLATDGRLYCWGDNNNGEVGNGASGVRSGSGDLIQPVPAPVLGQP